MNWASGLPGSGKSWLGLLTSRHVIRNGGRAACIDYEDSQPTLGNRARLLGLLNDVKDPDRSAYIPGGLIEEPGNRVRAIAWLAEADHGHDVLPWLTQHVEPFRAAGVGVVCLDHIPKRRTGRPAGPIGSVHKLATVDGAALRSQAPHGPPEHPADSGPIYFSLTGVADSPRIPRRTVHPARL